MSTTTTIAAAQSRQCRGCDRVHNGPATPDYTKWLLARLAGGGHAFYCPKHFPVMTEDELHVLSRAAEILQERGNVAGYVELADQIINVIGGNVAMTAPKRMPRAMVNQNRRRAGLEPIV